MFGPDFFLTTFENELKLCWIIIQANRVTGETQIRHKVALDRKNNININYLFKSFVPTTINMLNKQ